MNSAEKAIFFVAITAVAAVILGLVAANILTTQQMYIIWPMLAAGAVFMMFSYTLWVRVRGNLIGDIGFIYLALALAYTILPAIKFLMIDLYFPLDFDAVNFAVLSPQTAELGTHFWRHVLFISGVATGYLAVRGGTLPLRPLSEKSTRANRRVIIMIMAIVACSACIELLLSRTPATYWEHYIRYENLSGSLRGLVYLCSIFKNGGYFVLLALMFSQYRRYRVLIFIVVPTICAYEVIFSLGSRIVASTILMAFIGFYHFRVKPISMKKGILFLFVLASLFSGIAIIRASNYSLEDAKDKVLRQKKITASEFEAVYCTGFHLYLERARGTLPRRDWRMAFYEFISLIPFVDHKKYHPLYWYARNYFPEAIVPPTTMGVLADSAIWGGEMDLLIRSLINGAIFALLTRWFLRRRDKWWALTIYIYCYATCIMTIKYSVFYQLTPLVKVLLPPLLLTEVLFRIQRTPAFIKKSFTAEPVA
jgi:hypothetical protein